MTVHLYINLNSSKMLSDDSLEQYHPGYFQQQPQSQDISPQYLLNPPQAINSSSDYNFTFKKDPSSRNLLSSTLPQSQLKISSDLFNAQQQYGRRRRQEHVVTHQRQENNVRNIRVRNQDRDARYQEYDHTWDNKEIDMDRNKMYQLIRWVADYQFDQGEKQNKFDEMELYNLKQFLCSSRNKLFTVQQELYILDKISLIILQNKLKSLRGKRNSAKINKIILQMDIGNTSQAHKQRIYLLTSLETQLNRKVFITSLQYGKVWKRFTNSECIIDWNNICEQQVREQSDEYEIQDQLSDSQLIKTYLNKNNQEQGQYHQQNRLTIFTQILSTITARRIYIIFQQILHFSHRISEQQQSQVEQQMEKQEKIQALKNYISQMKQKLIQGPQNNKQLLFNYFTKWKLHFLYNMLALIEEEEGPQQMGYEIYGGEDQHYDFDHEQTKKTEMSKERNRKSLAIENHQDNLQLHNIHQNHLTPSSRSVVSYLNSQAAQNSLKRQKYQLKQYLYFIQCKNVFEQLRQNYSIKITNKICKQFYQRKLIGKTFQNLYNWKEIKQLQRKAEQNAEYYAQNQDQSSYTVAVLFNKTNLLTKVYFGLKSYRICSQFAVKLQNILEKVFIRRLRELNKEDKNKQKKLQRHLQRKQRILIYKYFMTLKNQTSSGLKLQQKSQQFIQQKNYEKMEIAFSVLSLKWKKKLALQRKIQALISRNRALLGLKKLKENHQKVEDQQYFQKSAVISVQQTIRQFWFKKLINYNYCALEKRAIEIKSQKLQIFLMDGFARKRIRSWRDRTIKKMSYQAIQLRLIRLKENQKKDQLFNIWRERTSEKQKKKKNLNTQNNHNIWLKRYYQQLCTLQNEK